ncbi:MAG: hypothetical protein GYB68_10710 [Chloroflexi bacterium]|nr:hypothetical protein [Chloroflexota bacterium]
MSERRPNRKQLSRIRREEQMQRYVLYGTAGVVAITIVIIAIALINSFFIVPSLSVAQVGDVEISVEDYQRRVRYEHFNLLSAGQNITPGSELVTLGEPVLEQMILEVILEEQAEEAGITITELEVEEELQRQFGFFADPDDRPTLVPTATPTEEVIDPTETPTPTATATFVITPTPSPTATLDPTFTVTPTPTLDVTLTPTPTPTLDPDVTPTETATPAPSPTPLTEEGYSEQLNQFLEFAARSSGLSEDDLLEVILQDIRGQLLRDALFEEFDFEPDEVKSRILLGHILVDTEDEALDVLERLDEGEEFEELAAEVSTDESNRFQGGNLGWNEPGRFVPAFDEVAFSIPANSISDPVQTTFGWHIIKVYEKVELPTEEFEQENQRFQAFNAQLDQWRAESDVEIEQGIWERFFPDL